MGKKKYNDWSLVRTTNAINFRKSHSIISLSELEEICILNGRLLNEIARKTYDMIEIEADVLDIAIKSEEMIKKCNKYLCSPASIEVNNVVNNFAPTVSYKLKKDDLVSYTLTLTNNEKGIGTVKCAYSKSLSGLHDDMIEILTEAAAAGINKSGPDARFSEVSQAISEVLQSAGVATLINVCGHSLRNAKRIIPNVVNPHSDSLNSYEYQNCKMEIGESFSIEVYGIDSAIDREAKAQFPTMFFIPSENLLEPRVLSHKRLFQLIKRSYGYTIFSLRDLLDKVKTSKLTNSYFVRNENFKQELFDAIFKKLVRQGYLTPLYGAVLNIDPYTGKQNVSAHIGHSILINEKKAVLLC